MYEFSPKPHRIREKVWMSICLFMGVLAYGFGQILSYPILYQLFSVVMLALAVLITVRYLLRDYLYRVELSENGSEDLTVIETVGKRRTVVCRVSVREIVNILPATEIKERQVLRAWQKKGIYRYTPLMRSKSSLFLEIFDEEKTYFLEIYADSDLILLLKELKKQYLSNE